ncbi:MAG: hypothetical protein BroJett011_33770 [Chloroflexota bacterium]|nr:MAG: hypothetical protein BroJett011_33770 [Chloroflexota bacterium]
MSTQIDRSPSACLIPTEIYELLFEVGKVWEEKVAAVQEPESTRMAKDVSRTQVSNTEKAKQ